MNLLFDEEETMTRARFGSWILGVALLLLFVSKSVTAIGPAAILLHGEGLQAPVVVRPQRGSFVFMWGGGTRCDNQSGVRIPSGLDGRRYLDALIIVFAAIPHRRTEGAIDVTIGPFR